MSEELKSCPFCGGEAIYGKSEASGRVRAVCVDCLASTDWLAGTDEAAAAWNCRAERTCRMEKDDRYSEMYEGPMLRCTRCDAPVPEIFTGQYNYCPNCGAKVIGETE